SRLRISARLARSHASPHIRSGGMRADVRGLVQQSETGFVFANDINGAGPGVGQVQRSVVVSRLRIPVSEWNQTSTMPLTRRLIRRSGVIAMWCWIVLAATT